MKIDPHEPFALADVPAASPAQQAARNQALAAETANRSIRVKILRDVFGGADGGPGYVAGDVCGLEQGHADALVARGLASFDLNAGPQPAPRRQEMSQGAPTAAAAGEVALRMLKPWGNLFPGDVAGFNPALAHELEVKGFGEPMTMSLPKRTLSMLRDALMKRRR